MHIMVYVHDVCGALQYTEDNGVVYCNHVLTNHE